jgi:eukaryotic translation initiation factor 2C
MMELESMTEEILKIFYLENNQIAPQRILFYRDGISESQFYDVATAELTAIRAACERLQAGYRPTITYVAVQKRHHARVFAMNVSR